MPIIGEQYPVDNNIRYYISPVHRTNQNSDKSLWSITTANELNCFINTYNNQWIINDKGWGIIINSEGKISILGYTPSNENSQIARFQGAMNNTHWHGYPWDRKKIKDKPSEQILDIWISKGYIDKSCKAKIRRCQLCTL